MRSGTPCWHEKRNEHEEMLRSVRSEEKSRDRRNMS